MSSSCDGTLKDVLVYCKPKQQKKIFYEILTMKINELESKKQFKCCWVPINLKEEKEIVLYPSKNGTVGTLLEEARKQVELCPDLGSGVLRIAEVIGSKNLVMGPSEDTLLQCEWWQSDWWHEQKLTGLLIGLFLLSPLQRSKRLTRAVFRIRRCTASRRCRRRRSTWAPRRCWCR